MKARRLKDVALALTIAAMGCAGSGGSEPKNEQRGGARAAQERLTVTGCVLAAAGNRYELHQLAEAPLDQQVATGSANSRPRLQAGSWARLSGGSDLKDHVGQRVRVEGWIADSGQGTMGTSGSRDPGLSLGAEGPNPNPPTVVAPVGALANGNAPEIAVERIKAEGSCSTGK
jgi:hypothetical protein